MNRILRKIGMVSLGCPKNTVDSELVLGTLASKGYNITADAGGAEVIVVNTCGFIDSAKEESIDTILEMAEYKRKGNCQKLIVMGCLSQRYTAYVKIAEGCSNRCSFCIIPKIRGPFKSRPADSIVREVEILSGHGVKEVNLISQDTTMYGVDLGIKNGLAGLLKRLVRIDGIKWIRLLYCYPAFLKDELINVIRDEEKICKYIDLPLQHSDDKILSKMMRQERGDKIRDLVNKIRKAIPDVAIRTVFIVGFPGEADTHFGHLVNFIKEMRFEHLGIFTYSPEEGTTAAEMSDQIPDEVKIERRDIIMKLQQKISSENNKRFVGMMRDVLVEDSVSDNEFLIKGRMQTQAPDIDGIVYIEEGDARVGDILPVKITRTMEYDFIGRAVNR